MKRVFWLGIVLTFFLTNVYFCKKTKEKEVSEPIKVTEPLLPKFESVKALDLFKLPLDSTFSGSKRKLLKRLYHDYWVANKVNGSIIIAKNGEILLEEYLGYGNFETKDTLTASTGIHIASVSKVLTAMVVMKLIEADSLKLNDDVRQFLPKFPYENITIKNLLTHRSGLPNYAYFAADPIWDTHKTLSNQEMLNLMVEHKPEVYNQPNKHFSYCNTNYALLALIIEKITGLSYPEAMRKILFKPLGMNDTFVFSMSDTARVSQSYGFRGKKWAFNFLDAIYGDKNIYSTPRDLLKFDIAMYSDYFLPKALKDSVFKGYSYESRGIKNYGLGIRMLEWGKGEELFYHNGWWHGNYSTFVHADKDTVSIIALGNKQNRSVYSPFNFITLFGEYPVELEGFPNAKLPVDSLTIDSLALEKQFNDSLEKEFERKPKKPKKKELPKIDTIKIDSLKIDSLDVESGEAPI